MFHASQAVLALSKEPNPTVFQKTLGVNDYYLASKEWEFPMGNIQMVGKSVAPMYRGEQPLLTKLAPTFTLDAVATHAVDFWLSTEDLPRPENRVTVRPRRQAHAELHLHERHGHGPPVRAAALAARPPGHARAPPDPALGLPGEQDPGRGGGPPGRDVPFRLRPRQSVLDTQLPRTRAGQPLRGRHQLLPEHRGGQPGADGDGQRASRRATICSSASADRAARQWPSPGALLLDDRREVFLAGLIPRPLGDHSRRCLLHRDRALVARAPDEGRHPLEQGGPAVLEARSGTSGARTPT